MTTSTFLLFHSGWHLARPGAIEDFREGAEEPGAFRLAWFDVASEGFVCWDGDPTVVRELTEDGSLVAERIPPAKKPAEPEWRDWAPAEPGGWPADLNGTDYIDVEYKNRRRTMAVRRDDVPWSTVVRWRRRTD